MEIEVRVKVDSLERVKLELVKLGALFSYKESQEDFIFKREEDLRAVQKAGSFLVRIRKTDTSAKFTFKALTETAGSWIEHETKISDPSEMREILLNIGFVEALQMHKEREHGSIEDINICLDSIKELGEYLELEIVSDNVQEGKRKLSDLLKRLGYSEEEMIHDGYVAILFKKQGVVFDGTG